MMKIVFFPTGTFKHPRGMLYIKKENEKELDYVIFFSFVDSTRCRDAILPRWQISFK